MYKAQVNDKNFEIDFEKGNRAKGNINGKPFDLDIVSVNDGEYNVIHNNKSYTILVDNANYDEKQVVLRVNGTSYTVGINDRFDMLLEELGLDNLDANKVNELVAPMPGLVLDVKVEVGDSVVKGDALLVLEAMKMENILKSPTDAIVKQVSVNKGEAVEKNQLLITFE